MTAFIHKLIFPIVSIMLVTGIAGNLLAQGPPSSQVVTVIGTAIIHGKDVPKARENAISNSLIAAVDQAALAILSPEILASHFKDINGIFYGRANQFVQNYKVLAETQTERVYRIVIEATVQTDKLEEQKKLLAAPAEKPQPAAEEVKHVATSDLPPLKPGLPHAENMPRVLFLIAEQDLADDSPQYWWGENEMPPNAFSEKAMAEKLKAKGFTVLEHGYRVSDGGGSFSVSYQPELDNQEAVSIGERLKADVVIVGKSVVYKVSDLMESSVGSFSGTASVRAIRTDTWEEIASSLQTAIKKNEDESAGGQAALTAAGELAGIAMATKIADAWRAEAPKAEEYTPEARPLETGMLKVIVRGTRHLGNFVRFRRALSDIPSVSEIQIREMKSDSAIITVDFQGDAKALADALTSREFELFEVRRGKVSQQSIRLELIPK